MTSDGGGDTARVGGAMLVVAGLVLLAIKARRLPMNPFAGLRGDAFAGLVVGVPLTVAVAGAAAIRWPRAAPAVGVVGGALAVWGVAPTASGVVATGVGLLGGLVCLASALR